jgi:O-methyltransferase involved in polyketide biosynthesis
VTTIAGKRVLNLGDVQETMLIPLHARAVETGKRHPILRDSAAVDIVRAIDDDFRRFGERPSALATYIALRTAVFDEWVGSFLARYPAGTVVEIGAGLSTRFERLDNGMATWIDIDLPDAIEVRRMFLPDEPRRQRIASSVLDRDWIDRVAQAPAPYLFVSEGVLVYLSESDVRRALALIAENFPGCRIAFDTYGKWIVREGGRRGPLKATRAELGWACDDPREIEEWGLGLRLVDSRTPAQPQERIRRRLPWRVRALLALITLALPKAINSTRMNLFQHDVGSGS